MTDFRALCSELLEALENAIRVIYHEDGTKHISTADAVIAKADAALAQPEPQGPTDPELTPLEEHNRRKQIPLMGTRPSMPNGIACPNCGKELMDSSPDYALLTHPIQYRVHCPHCDWSGTRF